MLSVPFLYLTSTFEGFQTDHFVPATVALYGLFWYNVQSKHTVDHHVVTFILFRLLRDVFTTWSDVEVFSLKRLCYLHLLTLQS